jgi:hypothetical protein
MGKGSKPNKATAPDGSLPSPASRAQAAEAARKRTGKSKTAGFPWLSSLAMLAVAIGLTLTFTTSPPQAPGVDPKPAASRDAAFAPQDRTSQCSSWVRDGAFARQHATTLLNICYSRHSTAISHLIRCGCTRHRLERMREPP